jgi:hypothetical protein
MTLTELLSQYTDGVPPLADAELQAALDADMAVAVRHVIAVDDRAQDRAWQTTCAALDKAARESRSD